MFPQQSLSRLEDFICFVSFYNTVAKSVLAYSTASPEFYTKSTVDVDCWWENQAHGCYPVEDVHPNIFICQRNHNFQPRSCFPVSRVSTCPAEIVLKSKTKKAVFMRWEPDRRREWGSLVLGLLHGHMRWEAGAFVRANGFILDCKASLFLAPSIFLCYALLHCQEGEIFLPFRGAPTLLVQEVFWH